MISKSNRSGAATKYVETMISPFKSSISPLQRMSQMNGTCVDRWRFTKEIDENLRIKSIEIWTKSAGSFIDNSQRKKIHIALRGASNTSVVLKLHGSDSCFMLNRVSNGIRLSQLPLNDDGESIADCNLFKTQEMVKLFKCENITNLPINRISELLNDEESKQMDAEYIDHVIGGKYGVDAAANIIKNI